MKKIIIAILLTLFPALIMAADGSLSFTPPASDTSVVFLGNIYHNLYIYLTKSDLATQFLVYISDKYQILSFPKIIKLNKRIINNDYFYSNRV